MNAERLLSLYERIADAPDAVGRLRRFVLDLAVRGKLVAQDRGDEQAPLFDVDLSDDIERPFKIPKSWNWTRLHKLGKLKGGGTPSKAREDFWQGNTPWVSPKDMKVDYLSNAQMNISEAAIRESAAILIDAGSVLFVVRGMILAHSFPVAVSKVPLAINQDMKALVLKRPDMAEFVLRVLKGMKPEMLRRVQRSSHGTCRLEGADYADFLVPIPPITEQHRIVAKVDELMALCDRLEAARAQREATRDRLAAASLTRLNAPAPDTFRDDARFALDALSALTTRPDQIKQLRQSILNLAVRGKLVAQDAGDEPAAHLMGKIQRSRASRRNFPSVDEQELEIPLPPLPPSWIWATVDQIADDNENAITDGPFGSNLKTSHYISKPGFRVIRLQNIGNGEFREEHRSFIERAQYELLRKHHVRAGDLVVAGLVDPRVRCCEVPGDIGPALVKADCYRLAVHPNLSSRFVRNYLNSELAQEFASVHHHGMTLTRIGLGNFRRIPVPVAPASEQHRIVAKVDELMALCDQLEASLTQGDTTRRRLLDALLTEALAPDDEGSSASRKPELADA